mgnify:CR=1 FL=1
MTKKNQEVLSFKVPCYFNGSKSDVEIHIGSPNQDNNPIYFQNKFIQNERGGQIPNEIIDSLDQLKKLSISHNVPLQELCAYAFKSLIGSDVQIAEAVTNNSPAESVLAQEVIGTDKTNDQIAKQTENSIAQEAATNSPINDSTAI